MTTDFLHGIEVIEIDDGLRTIQTVKSSVIGLIGTAPDADSAEWPLNAPVLLSNAPRKAATLGSAGTLKDGLDAIFDQAGASVIVVRVEEGADQAATLSNLIGDSAEQTGVHAFRTCDSELGVKPRILCAPGFTGSVPDGGGANPLVAEMVGIAANLRAVIIADGPNSTDADAVSWAAANGNDKGRIFVIDPYVKVWDTDANDYVNKPASARVAGMLARMDADKGFWWSPSNQIINNISGPGRVIEFALSDTNSQANYLNEHKVATIIQRGGYRLWGNRTTSGEPQWAFLSVRRTADMIAESVEQNTAWALDRPLSSQLIQDILESVNGYLRSLQARGAILGGKCFMEPELNTETNLKAGHLTLSFDIEPPAPMERLTFHLHRNGEYYDNLVEQVLEGA